MGRAAVIALWLVAGCHAVPAGERCYGDDCAFGLVCATSDGAGECPP